MTPETISKLTDLYDPQSAGINMPSPQSATTPRRLTLVAPLAGTWEKTH